MHQIQAETEDDILRKLEAFDWRRNPTAVISVLTDNYKEDNLLVEKTNRNHTQDNNHSHNNNRKHYEFHSETNQPQPPLFQITNIGRPNVNIDKQRLLNQRNEDLQESFHVISLNLILIARKHESAANSNNIQEYIDFKTNVFTLLNSIVSKLILPRCKDQIFISSFLRETANIGLRKYNYYASYICLEKLFQEMINFTNSQQNQQNETEKNVDSSENVIVSSFCNKTSTISNKEGSQKAIRRKSNPRAKSKANEINDSQVQDRNAMSSTRTMIEGYFDKHHNNSDQSNMGQQAINRSQPPPYPGLSEVAMSPVSLDGDNDTRQLSYLSPSIEVPVHPSISFVTSLNPELMRVADGHCRICKRITNRICLGCTKINAITYYCSQICQEIDWYSHMFYCWRSF